MALNIPKLPLEDQAKHLEKAFVLGEQSLAMSEDFSAGGTTNSSMQCLQTMFIQLYPLEYGILKQVMLYILWNGYDNDPCMDLMCNPECV